MTAELSLADYIQFIAALIAVICLIAGLGWIAKRIDLPNRMMQARAGRRLNIIEQLPIDSHSRIAIIRCDAREHLILIQRQSATVIDASVPQPPDSAAGPSSLASPERGI